MDKKQILETAGQLIKHLKENPSEIKKFEAPPTTETKPIQAAASKPTGIKPYFISEARAEKIMELAKSMKSAKKMPNSLPQEKPSLGKEEKGKSMPNTLPQEKPSAGSPPSQHPSSQKDMAKDEKAEDPKSKEEGGNPANAPLDKECMKEEKEEMDKQAPMPAPHKPPMQMNMPPTGAKPKMPGSMHLPQKGKA